MQPNAVGVSRGVTNSIGWKQGAYDGDSWVYNVGLSPALPHALSLALMPSCISPTAVRAPYSGRAGAAKDIRAGHASVDDAVRNFIRFLCHQPKLG